MTSVPLLEPPQFPGDDEKTRVAGIINSFLLIAVFSAAASIPLLFAFASVRLFLFSQLLVFILGCLVLLGLLRRGYILSVSLMGFLLISAAIFIEGLISPTVGVTTSVALLLAAAAGLAYSVRGVFIVIGLHTALIWVSVLIKLSQSPSAKQANRLMYEGGVYTLFMAATLVVVQLIVRHMATMRAKTKRTAQDLLERNQQLEKEIAERWQLETALQQANTVLEQRVAKRTQDWYQMNQSLLQEVAERKQAQEAISHRVEFEHMAMAISSKFMSLPPDKIDEGIQFALQTVTLLTHVDICALSQIVAEAKTDGGTNTDTMHECTHEWISPDAVAAGKTSRLGIRARMNIDNGWWLSQFETAGYAQINSVDALEPPMSSTHNMLKHLGINSVIMVPIMFDRAITGTLILEGVKPNYTPTNENIVLLRLVAELIGMALERKKAALALKTERDSLELHVAERTHELSKLLEVTQTVLSTLELQPLLKLILQQLQEVVPYDAAGIGELRSGGAENLVAYIGPISENDLVRDWPTLSAEDALMGEMFATHKPMVVPDLRADKPCANAMRERYQHVLGAVPKHVSSILLVPMVVRERIIGLMNLTHPQPGYYTAQHAELARAFANQAAIAIENARLHAQEIQAAAIGERSRLARELHDSVSQALFGIILGTRTALEVAIRSAQVDTEAIMSPLHYILSLSETALGELRALIFELHPESLQSEGLIVALRKQSEILMQRSKSMMTTDLDTQEPDVSLITKEVLYRIGIEAIQNLINHAHATKACLVLRARTEGLVLEVSDNGQGFDPNSNFPGHLGLQSMRERAAQCGAVFQIESKPEQGTTIRVIVPLAT